jgi:hypothetical protein
MKVYRLPAKLTSQVARHHALAPVIHRARDAGAALVTQRTYDALARLGSVDTAVAEDLAGDRLADARRRLLFSWSSHVNQAAPDDVLDEAYTLLAADPGLTLEYMGRGRFFNELHMPASESNIVWLDRAHGRRSYLFRKVECTVPGEYDGLMRAKDALYEGYRAWVNEPGARIVLSMGGGGWRLFSVPGVLRMIDHLLVDRAQIGEVWGCSGGAILGYAYTQIGRAHV